MSNVGVDLLPYVVELLLGVVAALVIAFAVYASPKVPNREFLETTLEFSRELQISRTRYTVHRGSLPFFKHHFYRNKPVDSFDSFDSTLTVHVESGEGEWHKLDEHKGWHCKAKDEKGVPARQLFVKLDSPGVPSTDVLYFIVETSRERPRWSIGVLVDSSNQIEKVAGTTVTVQAILENKSNYLIKDYEYRRPIRSAKNLTVLGVWKLSEGKTPVPFKPTDPEILVEIPLPNLPSLMNTSLDKISDIIFAMYVDLSPGKTEIDFSYEI